MLEGGLRVQAEALARARPSRSAGPLAGRGLGNRRHHERVHSHLRVEHLLLREARVHHVIDPVDCQRRLGDVRRNHALSGPLGRGVEDLRLHLRGQGAVDGQDDQLRHRRPEALHSLVQNLAGRVNLLLARQEDEDVPFWLRQVNLHHRHQAGVQVVGLRVLRVQDLHGEHAPGNGEDRAVEEVGGEFFCVQSRRGDDDFDVLPLLDEIL
mmetsp:Transcript_7584/g.18636  ORF Transcript_7584/g.18636 Transcript_7584/m.18636 type:complete len:210 (+) Transcript_7584:1096-1725(+)